MPIDYFAGKTEAELVVILGRLQKQLTSGTITEMTSAGVRTVRTAGSKSLSAESQIRRVLYALYLRNPTDYTDPYASRIRRTQADYIR